MTTVTVKFSTYDKQTYSYLIPTDTSITPGDKVVVDSPYNGLVICSVVSIGDDPKATKPIVQKIDMTWYNSEKDRIKERAAILAKLAKIEKEHADKNKYAYLAALSPEAAELLRKLKDI